MKKWILTADKLPSLGSRVVARDQFADASFKYVVLVYRDLGMGPAFYDQKLRLRFQPKWWFEIPGE